MSIFITTFIITLINVCRTLVYRGLVITFSTFALAPESVEVISYSEQQYKVIIVDAMGVVNKICKGSDRVKSCKDLKEKFIERIEKSFKNYEQARIVFDQYEENSLKEKTRLKRAGDIQPIEFTVTDETQLKLIKINVFLSHINTKAKLTEYLGSALASKYKDSDYPLIVSYNGKIFCNKPAEPFTALRTHSHEEADTVIPLCISDLLEKYP